MTIPNDVHPGDGRLLPMRAGPMPSYQSQTIDDATIRVAGKLHADRPLELGDTVLLVIVAEVTDVGHRYVGREDRDLVRSHTLTVVDGFEPATDIEFDLATYYQEALDLRAGRTTLPLAYDPETGERR